MFNLPNFSKYETEKVFKNKQTISGYKIYNKGLFYEFTLVEARMSRQLRHQGSFFNNFEKDSILTNQVRILLNMVPVDIVQHIESKKIPGDPERFYDKFGCLELLKGQSMVDFNISNTSQVYNYIHADDKEQAQEA